MHEFDNLTEDNFLIYAVKNYDTPHCIMSEFEGDIKRTKYLKRLFRRYKVNRSIKDLKERLILNHIILIANVFGIEATVRILFFRVDERDYDILKTFLVYLNLMPKVIKGIRGKDIQGDEILLDLHIAEILRKL